MGKKVNMERDTDSKWAAQEPLSIRQRELEDSSVFIYTNIYILLYV